jgi:NAD(P)-dependent dehydrogenase (short-subunit alcohol dehydrogenase family)
MGLRILVTGATRGLGRAMSEAFAELGHTVLGCGTSEANVEAIRAALPAPHRFEKIDVSDDKQVAAWANSVQADAYPIDLLLNNAAVINDNGPLWKVSAEAFRKVMDVNVTGSVNVLRHFLPGMIKRGKGVVVNFSSGWGRSTSPEVGPYCASKYAVEGFTLALAQELPKGMAAIPLNPGVIDTDMLRSAFGDEAGSYPDPKKWAKIAVPYILSLSAKHNGQSLSVPV